METDWPYEYPGINWLNKEKEEDVPDVVGKGSLFRYQGPHPPTHVTRLARHGLPLLGRSQRSLPIQRKGTRFFL